MAGPLVLYASQTGNAQVGNSTTAYIWLLCICERLEVRCICAGWGQTVTMCVQDVAERIAREAAYQLYEPRVMPMDSYDITKLVSEQLVIFVTSTTGQVNAAAAS